MSKPTVFIGALAALAVVGCGSSGTKSVTASTATSAVASKPAATKAQFIAQAAEVCKGWESQIAPVRAHIYALETPSENSASIYKTLGVLLREEVTVSRTALKKLEALARPSADMATIEKILKVYSEGLTDENNAATAVTNQENTAFQAALAATKKAGEYDRRLAQGYGMKVCDKPK